MASFSADLQVESFSFPVVYCTYATDQAISRRGQVIAKVRYSLVQLVLDVPTTDFLLNWAQNPTKRYAVAVVFRDAKGGSAIETLHLAAAYCVSYREQFESGSSGTGAYQCQLELSDPGGFTMHAGGPGSAVSAPAAAVASAAATAAATAAASPVAKAPRATGGYNPNSIVGPDGYRKAAADVPAAIRSINDVPLTQAGIAKVSQHLSRAMFLSDDGAMAANNTVMIARLQAAERGERPLEEVDKYFYTHELREVELMDGQGLSYDDAHAASCKEYGVTVAMEKNNVFYTQEALDAWEAQERKSLGL